MLQFDYLFKNEEKKNLDFTGKMIEVEMSVEGESHPKYP